MCYELLRTQRGEPAAWEDEQPWRSQSRGSGKQVSFMKKQTGCPWRKATRRNRSLCSGAWDNVTTPASLESPLLQIHDTTSYAMKNILKIPQFLSICASYFRHTNVLCIYVKLSCFLFLESRWDFLQGQRRRYRMQFFAAFCGMGSWQLPRSACFGRLT